MKLKLSLENVVYKANNLYACVSRLTHKNEVRKK